MRAMKDSGVEWIGEIPEGWNLRRLKYVVSLRNKKIDDNDLLIPYIGLEHVACENGALINGYTPITSFNGDTIEFKRNDILFGKLRPYLAKALRTAFDGKCSSEFWVMKPKRVDAQFLLYSVLSSSFLSCIDHSTFGVKMPRAEWSFASNQLLSLPPAMEEQSRIADYLDAKCAEIDALIVAKERTNALLKEQRQSIIYEAVTKGLDPDVPMKDSGIEWVGVIPEGWETRKIKYCFKFIAGATPKSGNTEYWDGEIAWITPADYTTEGVYVSGGHKSISQEGLESCATSLIPIGSIIFSKRAPIGLVAINSTELCTNQGCLSCVPYKGTNVKFYFYSMSVFTEQFDLFGSGTTFKEISANDFANFLLPCPKKAMQDSIADYLDTKCAEIDALIAANNTTIQKLKEYRQSVIYEAVTGKTEI